MPAVPELSSDPPRAVARERPHDDLAHLPRPVMTCVGRLAVEENLEAFLSLPLAGTQVLIGDGPLRAALAARYAAAVFLGYRCGAELAQLLGAPDVRVFPSLTDTFGLAMIEALAWGVAAAAFPVPGPADVIEPGISGVRRADLGETIPRALRLNRHVCAARAGTFSREAATSQFLGPLAPIPLALRARVAVSRSSAMIERIAARRHTTSHAGDAN